jgi:DinB superfamily
MISRPQLNEYNPHYKGYIGLVPDGDLQEILKNQLEKTTSFYKSIKEKSEYRYAEGKWSIKEVLGHIVDTERVMSYRLLAIARGDKSHLPSFDENAYNENAKFNLLELDQIVSDYINVRKATLSLLSVISEEAFENVGTVFNSPTTSRAIAYIIAGHELHHLKIINERYL